MIKFRNSKANQWYLLHPWEYIADYCRDLWAFYQRGTRGYADYDTWSFNSYLTEVLAGGLKGLSKWQNGYPGWGEAKTMEKWQRILKRMQSGFQDVLDFEEGDYWVSQPFKSYAKRSKVVYKNQDKSLKLLSKWFNHLWD